MLPRTISLNYIIYIYPHCDVIMMDTSLTIYSLEILDKLILVIDGWGVYSEIAPGWMTLNLTDNNQHWFK